MDKETKKENISFTKDFWTKERPHVTKKEKEEDMIPFEWSDDVLSGKSKVIICPIKKTKKSLQ